jgi:N-acyl homoserine lactone hydrolase
MKMHVLSGGRLRMKKSIFVPEADRSETIELPVNCVLLRHPQGNVLFDTGCHPDIATNAESRWGAAVKSMMPAMPAGDNVIAALAAVGVTPTDIDLVVNSHLHTDHCGCNQFFTNATCIVHAKELANAQDPQQEGRGYYRNDWDFGLPWKTIEAQHDVFGDGRIVLVPLPGHSPGTIGARVNLDGAGEFFLAADTVSIRDNLDRETVPRNTWNAELFSQSLQEIKRIEATGATVICGHDEAQWRTLKTGVQFYD